MNSKLASISIALLAGALLAACGDDDEAASTTTEASADENEELCALAQELYDQEDFPSAAQIEKYTELAPAEIADAVSVAGPPVIEADGDAAAFLAAVADDDVDTAQNEINAWELENCGIDHETDFSEEARTIDPAATRVDVTASEYTFDFLTNLAAGPTSFVMTNAGNEVHFMVISGIAEGHTVEEVLAFEGDPEEAGLVTGVDFESGLAATGGDDEEVITADLTAGSWAMFCFVDAPDGYNHASNGIDIPCNVEWRVPRRLASRWARSSVVRAGDSAG